VNVLDIRSDLRMVLDSGPDQQDQQSGDPGE